MMRLVWGVAIGLTIAAIAVQLMAVKISRELARDRAGLEAARDGEQLHSRAFRARKH